MRSTDDAIPKGPGRFRRLTRGAERVGPELHTIARLLRAERKRCDLCRMLRSPMRVQFQAPVQPRHAGGALPFREPVAMCAPGGRDCPEVDEEPE